MQSVVDWFADVENSHWLTGVKVLLVLGGGWVAIGLLRRTTTAALQRGGVDAIVVHFLGRLLKISGVAVLILAALSVAGIPITPLLAVLGAAGLAIGLALQGSLSHLASGILLSIFRPFRQGDVVEIAGVVGKVEDLRLLATYLATPDNRQVIIPNAQILNDKLINFSTHPTRRVDLVFGVSYSADISNVKRVLREELAKDPRILADPAPTVAVLALADNSVSFAVRPWVKVVDYWPVFFDLNERVKMRFDAEGIKIPFPQRDVHVFQEK